MRQESDQSGEIQNSSAVTVTNEESSPAAFPMMVGGMESRPKDAACCRSRRHGAKAARVAGPLLGPYSPRASPRESSSPISSV
eukprot:scaffold1320_cov253-Pinguiococcus_pyrenoidosus.AAC.6